MTRPEGKSTLGRIGCVSFPLALHLLHCPIIKSDMIRQGNITPGGATPQQAMDAVEEILAENRSDEEVDDSSCKPPQAVNTLVLNNNRNINNDPLDGGHVGAVTQTASSGHGLAQDKKPLHDKHEASCLSQSTDKIMSDEEARAKE